MPNNKKMMDVARKPIGDNNKSISWQAPEFVQFSRSIWWYVVLIVVGLGLMVAFYFINQNYLGMGAVGLAVIVMIISVNQKPKTKKYTLSNTEISIDDKVMSLTDFKSYYITYVNNVGNIHLERVKKLSAPISMYVLPEDEAGVTDVLKTLLPENVKINTTASDLFSNWFRF